MDNLAKLTDERLLAEMSGGNALAFDEFYFRFQDKVYRHAKRFVRFHDQAEDLTQEVFVRLWEQRSKFGDIQDANALLHTLTRNTFLNALKKQRVVSHPLDALKDREPSANSTEFLLNYADAQRIFGEAVGCLPSQTQKVYRMNKEDGLSSDAISAKAGISKNTVKYHLKRSIRHIRSYFALHSPDTIVSLLIVMIFHYLAG